MQQTDNKQDKKSGTYFIAKKIMPNGDNQAAVLPSDQWMLKNLWQSARSSKSFFKHTANTIAHAAMSAISVVTLTVGAVLVASTNIALGAILVGTIGAGYFGKKTKDTLSKMKKTHLPHIQNEMKKRLVKYKTDQFFSAMKSNLNNKQETTAPTNEASKTLKPGIFRSFFQKASKIDDCAQTLVNSAVDNNKAPENKIKNTAAPKK